MQEDDHSRQTGLGQNELLRLGGVVQEDEHSRQTVCVHDVQAICSFYAHPSPMARVEWTAGSGREEVYHLAQSVRGSKLVPGHRRRFDGEGDHDLLGDAGGDGHDWRRSRDDDGRGGRSRHEEAVGTQ